MRQHCPSCGANYDTILDRPEGDDRPIQEIYPDAPTWQREQLISGLCSDECWDAFVGKFREAGDE